MPIKESDGPIFIVDFSRSYRLISCFRFVSHYQKIMKTKLVALAALLLACVYPSVASADPLPTGKIAGVTIAFTFTYDVGGYPTKGKSVTKSDGGGYYKLLTNTPTVYKEAYSSILTTSKYGNTEFLTDLINNEVLDPSTKAGDWKIVYVEVANNETRGFFAVNKKTSSVVFIGGYDQSCYPINLVSKDGSGYTENYTDTTTYNAMHATLSQTEVGSYKGVESYCLKLKPYNNSTIFKANGLLYIQGTYSSDYFNDIYTYTAATTTLSGLVGDDGDGTIIGGSLSIDGLIPLKDATPYLRDL